MKKIFITAAASAMLMTNVLAGPHEEKADHEKHWDYSQNGPTHWGEFSKTCSLGHSQSPVNIVPGKTIKMNPRYSLKIDSNLKTEAKIIDNGHSIKVTPVKGGTIELNGEKFVLQQFHFHGKSEHTIDGKRYDMVAHLVYQNPKTKQYAVIAVFFKEGKRNPLLDKIINNVGKTIVVDRHKLLPKDTQHYFHYVGSFTTPPCTENVQWYLLKQPSEASKDQIETFRKYYVDNERPVQELYDRDIEAQ